MPGNGSLVLMPGQGKMILLPDRGARVRLLAAGPDTGEGFAIVESAPAPGAPGLPRHRHQRSDEALYTLEGEVMVSVDGRTVSAPAGSFIFIPRGTVHRFWNPGPKTARVLVIFVPAGLERYLEETADAFAGAGGVPDPSKLQAIRVKHDTELVAE
jgi:quercetin dioxygenase-like cupin family protein